MNPQGGIPVARLFGIEIRIAPAWALLAAVVILAGAEQAAVTSPGLAAPLQWLLGAGVALLFLVSVVGHELLHALVGRRLGVPNPTIVVGFVSGTAPSSIEAQRPLDEFLIAVSGPALSLGLAVLLISGSVIAGLLDAGLRGIAGGVLLVGGLNLVLGVVSLLPGLPLDGGRIIRALAWAWTGNVDRAGKATVIIGRLAGWGTVGVGVAMAMADLVTPGLLVLCLGWLLAGGARRLEQRLALEQLLRGLTVGEVMQTDGPRVGPNLTVDTFANRFGGEDGVSSIPVLDGERVLGVIGIRRLQRLGRRNFGNKRASDALTAPPLAPLLAPGTGLWDAVDRMEAIGQEGLAVVDGDRYAGMLTRDAIGKVVRERSADAPSARRRR